jgi:hypothetical protein
MEVSSMYKLLACNFEQNSSNHSEEFFSYLSCVGTPISAENMLRVKRKARGSNGQQEKRKRVKEVSSIISDCKDMVESTKQKLYWKELSQELATKFCASIVSLASFDGDYTLVFPVVSLVYI